MSTITKKKRVRPSRAKTAAVVVPPPPMETTIPTVPIVSLPAEAIAVTLASLFRITKRTQGEHTDMPTDMTDNDGILWSSQWDRARSCVILIRRENFFDSSQETRTTLYDIFPTAFDPGVEIQVGEVKQV